LAIGLENKQRMVKPPQQMAVNDYNPFQL